MDILKEIEKQQDFRDEIRTVLNRYSMENGSNTPDFVLAKFLKNCLHTFDLAVKERDNWYGGKQSILDSEKETKWEV